MTNVMHKFFSMYLCLIITLYMFRAHRVYHQEKQIVSIQPLVTVNLFGGRVVCMFEVDSAINIVRLLPEDVYTICLS
jgi:putative effector of murein hydrolase